MFSLIAPQSIPQKLTHSTVIVCRQFIKTNLCSLPPSHPIIINWGNKKHQTEALLLKHSQNNECFSHHLFELKSLLKINNVFRSGLIRRGTCFLLPLSVSVNTREKETRPGLFFAWSGVKIYMRGKKSSIPQKKLVLASHNDCYSMLHDLSLSLVSTWITICLSAHILARLVMDPSPLRDEYLISMLRKRGPWWHRHGCAALVLLWVTWILENVSICEEKPVGWI